MKLICPPKCTIFIIKALMLFYLSELHSIYMRVANLIGASLWYYNNSRYASKIKSSQRPQAKRGARNGHHHWRRLAHP